jgi:DNA-binding SARP family transcriptional activator
LLRPRLLAPLVADDAPGVVVVIAPAGSGKTTLLSRAAALSPRPAAWFAAGPGERSGPDFVRGLARATAEVLGEDLGDPENAAQLSEALGSRADRSVLLVMDDVHELEGSPAERELADLLRWRPPNVRVALGTRRPLASNTPRLMVSGELVELDSDALRFRSWEVEELFRLVYSQPLSPEAAAALTRRTGGWAAGLMLFHLSTNGKSAVERERAVADLGGRSRLLRSYLTRTVLDELDPERREFLLATCTLGVLTGPLCDALLEWEGSAAVLEELASRQFFTTLDENGRSYRYHQVLQTLLEGLLVDELGHRAATDLYARSALLLESEGLLREALRAYAMAEDFASVARVLQLSGAGLAMDSQLVDDTGDDPWLALVRARWLQREGAFAAAVSAFREAEALLDDSEFRRRCVEERAVSRVWLADATIPDHPGPDETTPRAVALAVRAATRRVPPPDRLPSQPLAEGVALLLAGEVGPAARTLAHVVSTSAPEQLYADLARLVAEIAGGAAGDVVATLEQLILTAELEEQPWLARVARGVQAAVLLVSSRETWRVESCESLVEDCRRSHDQWGEVLLAGALGIAHVLRRDHAAGPWLDRAADGAHALGAPVLAAWADAVGAFAARQQGAPDAHDRADRARARARAAGVVGAESLVTALLSSGREPTPTAETAIVIRCLGTFGIEAAGTGLTLPPLRPLPRTLLLLLALNHGRDVHREVLIDMLWPGTPLDAATHRLHAAASSVRRCLAGAGLGDDVVRRHGSAYSLRLEGATLDVADFEALLREAARREATGDPSGALAAHLGALDLYRGDLLGEAGPAEWVVAERDRLRVAAAAAAYAAGQLSLRVRPPGQALPLARRAIELDPLRDSAWALLAETQERMGDLRSADATRHEQALISARLASRDDGFSPAPPRRGGPRARA